MKWILRNLEVDCYSQGLLKSNLSGKMWTPQSCSDQYLYWNVKGHQARPAAWAKPTFLSLHIWLPSVVSYEVNHCNYFYNRLRSANLNQTGDYYITGAQSV